MEINETSGRTIAVYSTVLGLFYFAFGIVEIMVGLGFIKVLFVPQDIFGGIMLLIVASVFLTGIKEQWKGNREGVSYFSVGILLATVFFGLYLLIMVSNGLGHLLQFEDWVEWRWLDDLRPGIWLFPSALPGAYLTRRKKE
jgi:hypothetical protein